MKSALKSLTSIIMEEQEEDNEDVFQRDPSGAIPTTNSQVGQQQQRPTPTQAPA